MSRLIFEYGFYLMVLIILAVPLGFYMGKVMNGEKTFLSKILTPCENFIYRIIGSNAEQEMTWKEYAVNVLLFSGIGLIFLFALQILQGILPGNPQHIPGMSWHLSFNTATSFITNTNWQAYSGESQLSYLTQFLGLTVQNFLSAATGISVLFALVRGLNRAKVQYIGNFWVDLVRSVLYVLMPLSILLSLFLVSQGVSQNLRGNEVVSLLEPVAVSADGVVLENAVIDLPTKTVMVDGKKMTQAKIVTEQFVPMGPAASQIAIKQLGTNGGGYYGVNSAHPLENPTWFSNLLEMLAILLIPVSLCFAFGRNIHDLRQGTAVFAAMLTIFILAFSTIAVNEQKATPELWQNGAVDLGLADQSGGNMEGKESRFGIAASASWAAFTTAASNGSVNAMHDSLTPLSGMMTMLLMQLGEVVFGGVGCGLYGMLAFLILTVFIAGLMVGKTPEYLSKKIEPYEMKWATIASIIIPIFILVGSGIAVVIPGIENQLNNSGAHGFSEILYAYTSASGNNGSAFAGFNANTPFLNISLGICMLACRFIPIIAILAIAGSMAKKQKIAVTAGTLSTTTPMFVLLLILVVLLVGALSFFPALSLGPIAEYFNM